MLVGVGTVGVDCDFIPVEPTVAVQHLRVGEKVDDVTALSPCFHYRLVVFRVPHKRHHAVHPVMFVLLVLFGAVGVLPRGH